MTEIGKFFGEDVLIREGAIVGEDTKGVHIQDTVQLCVGLSTTVFALIQKVDPNGELVPYPAQNNPKRITRGQRVQKIICPHLNLN